MIEVQYALAKDAALRLVLTGSSKRLTITMLY